MVRTRSARYLAAGMGTGKTGDKLISDEDVAPGLPASDRPAAHARGMRRRSERRCSFSARPDLHGRPLQREQGAGGRLPDDTDRPRTGRIVRQPSSTRSCSAPVATPATTSSIPMPAGGGSRSTGRRRSPKGRDADRRNGLSVRRRRALEYSERIYAEFAHQLRSGSGPVSIGKALLRPSRSTWRPRPTSGCSTRSRSCSRPSSASDAQE